ncbi:hypothetical protein RA307_26440 [Xanthobacteraceae bacterium Astr-EGSB]|uniref:hypothetical protein n=1 Tax=Astrobacterium formosum TaxID=3069710 RepID=UPI0027B3EBEC|nr:hypothetical protein [Xanthobacteraceae bacterium Astr-EGSB]
MSAGFLSAGFAAGLPAGEAVFAAGFVALDFPFALAAWPVTGLVDLAAGLAAGFLDLASDLAIALVSGLAVALASVLGFAVLFAGARVLVATTFVVALPVAEANVVQPTLASVASAQMVSIFRGFKVAIPPPVRIKGAP